MSLTGSAWHAGVCRPSSERLAYQDANSALYGIAAATNDKVDVTAEQLRTIANLTKGYFDQHGWDIATEGWRITGHGAEAWPRGRKTDPEGSDPELPIYSPGDVRRLLGEIY